MGRPKGSGKLKKEPAEVLIDMLTSELTRKVDGYPKAGQIVKALVKKAEEGDSRVGMWIFDRICGKPKESRMEPKVSVTDFFPDAKIEEFEERSVPVREKGESEVSLRLYEDSPEAERIRDAEEFGFGQEFDSENGEE